MLICQLLHRYLKTFYMYICCLLWIYLKIIINVSYPFFLGGCLELHLAAKLLHKVMLRADPELVSDCVSLIIKHWAISNHHQMKVFF